jgi:hypothetical protein
MEALQPFYMTKGSNVISEAYTVQDYVDLGVKGFAYQALKVLRLCRLTHSDVQRVGKFSQLTTCAASKSTKPSGLRIEADALKCRLG